MHRLDPAPDELTAALLPVVIHQLNNATQLLANFHALLSLGGAEELLRSRSGDLADTARNVHELGYVLALLASASGANLLLERREEEGLAWLLTALRDGLRRDGKDLAPCPSDVPHLCASVGEGWELPWGIASLLFAGASQISDEASFAWSLVEHADTWRLHLPGVAPADLGVLPARLEERLPDSRCVAFEDGTHFVFPDSWLRSCATPVAGGDVPR